MAHTMDLPDGGFLVLDQIAAVNVVGFHNMWDGCRIGWQVTATTAVGATIKCGRPSKDDGVTAWPDDDRAGAEAYAEEIRYLIEQA